MKWVIFLVLVLCFAPSLHAQSDIYVSSRNGDDSAPGTSDAPFRTLERAAAMLVSMSPLGSPTTVHLDGTFYLRESLDFSLISVASGGSLQITSNSNAVISGGYLITTPWTQDPSNSRLYTTVLPESFPTHQLFVDDTRRIRARSPNTDVYNDNLHTTSSPFYTPSVTNNNNDKVLKYVSGISNVGIVYSAGDVLDQYKNQEDVQFVVYEAWTAARTGISQIFPENNSVIFVPGAIQWDIGGSGAKGYYIENAFEYLDSPGEWYLDRSSNTLFYYTLNGEDPNASEMILSNLTRIFSMVGSSSNLLQNIWIQGVHFAHTDFVCDSCGESQSNSFFLDAAILVQFSSNIKITECEFSHIGEQAVAVMDGTSSITLDKNHVWDSAANGFLIGTYQPWTGNLVSYITVTNNYLHGMGRVFQAGTAIFVIQCDNVYVGHNEVSDTYYSSITVGWNWGYGQTWTHDNTIEYNYLHHLGQAELSDMGGVYTLGIQNGTKVHQNIIHDVTYYNYGGWGLYLDEGTSFTEWTSNVVYNTMAGPFNFHYGEYNDVKNNLLIDRQSSAVQIDFTDGHYQNNYISNVFVSDGYYAPLYSAIYPSAWENDTQPFFLDNNVYVNFTCGELAFPFNSWEAWQQHQDKNSVIVPGNYDLPDIQSQIEYYNNLPEAQARGWTPIDLESPGLQNVDGLISGSDWVLLPSKYPFPTMNPSTYVYPYAEGGIPVGAKESFETENLGASVFPVGMQYNGAFVTDAQASTPTPFTGVNIPPWTGQDQSSRQSLAVVGNPNQNPWYEITFNQIVGDIYVIFAYDIYVVELGALWFEVRNWQVPNAAPGAYAVGPSFSYWSQGDGSLQVQIGGSPAQFENAAPIQLNSWVHVEVTFPTGKIADMSYNVKIQQGGNEWTTSASYSDTNFTMGPSWVGLGSASSNDGVTNYIDNFLYGTLLPYISDATIAQNILTTQDTVSIQVQFQQLTSAGICYFSIAIQDVRNEFAPFYVKASANMNGDSLYSINVPLVSLNIPPGDYSISITAFTEPHTAINLFSNISVTITEALTANGEGGGLTGDYYIGDNFDAYSVSEVDVIINFDFGTSYPPALPNQNDYFSIVWNGQIQALSTGTYTFYASSDDGAQLFINGQTITDSWVPQAQTEIRGTFAMNQGQKYNIQLKYMEQAGDAAVVLSWSGPGVPKQVIPQSQLYPCVAPVDAGGNGLRGFYYSDMGLTNLVGNQTDATINMGWSSQGPAMLNGQVNEYSVQWTGYVVPRYSGVYTFTVVSDDGSNLSVNGVQLVNDWTTHPATPFSGTIFLVGGLKYPILLQYFQQGGGASVSLWWANNCQPYEIIPQSQLFIS